MSKPLVSVICICHNHQPYVKEAIESVLSQSYEPIELIVVDDASTDGSKERIQEAIDNKSIELVSLEQNIGNCKAFNLGLAKSSGEYIIDLAADDLLLPQRVALGVLDFLQTDPKAGVHFSDAFIINEKGETLKTHYNRDQDGNFLDEIAVGNVYETLIKRYFICPPSMMMKRSVLDELNGYDEDLYYEDFDFWIRSSRKYNYIFNRAPLVKKRILKSSLSSTQRRFFNKHQQSTLKVCQKIFDLNKKPSEYQALISRSRYEIKHALLNLNWQLVSEYLKLIKKSKEAYRRLSSPSSMER